MAGKSKGTTGVCRLTRKSGQFVNAHIIPKALTKPETPGKPFVESGDGNRPRRRWSSWTDQALVIREGEDIFARLDDSAIVEMRKHALLWSSWGPRTSLGALHDEIPNTGWGVRSLQISDPSSLRLFYLSVLWRASASSRPEFSAIKLPPEDEERLRLMLVAGDPGDPAFYPISLTQLSTLGPIHNHTPIAQIKKSVTFGNEPVRDIPFYRFYFDGLIAHVHAQSKDLGETVQLGPLVLGLEKTLAVSTVTYEKSLQKETLEQIVGAAAAEWPDVLARLFK